MAGKHRSIVPLLAVLLVAIGVALWIWRPADPPPPGPARHLADLGTPPDWTRLDVYQRSIPRDEFVRLLKEVYTIGAGWQEFIEITESAALIARQRGGESPYRLEFAPAPSATPPPRYWRSAAELGPAPAARPLQGVRIAIDPGHIGGTFARMEERWFQVSDRTQPVMEGEMTLRVAQHLQTGLEGFGATVTLLRDSNAPVTDQSVEDFTEAARARVADGADAEVRALAERLFYRTAEIRARARKVNDEIRPDLVLCLHFNAEGWGDPGAPVFSPRNHFHVLLNGAYTAGEVAHDDERFEMLLKILQRVHAEESALAGDLIAAFGERTGLPPYVYEPNSLRALPLDDSFYLWARNLLANRLYECPVLFLEPYVMNNAEVHERIQAGDYEGIKPVAGADRPSIYREYAAAVRTGLERYYRTHRRP